MEKLHFSTTIHAKPEKVWHTMLASTTYRKWAKPFGKDSFYEGDWNEGSEIKFLSLDKKGKVDGVYSRIKESDKYVFLSIEHLGIIKNDKVDTTSEEVKSWAPVYENYRLTDNDDGSTTLDVEMDIEKANRALYENIWPEALGLLKNLCEQ